MGRNKLQAEQSMPEHNRRVWIQNNDAGSGKIEDMVEVYTQHNLRKHAELNEVIFVIIQL